MQKCIFIPGIHVICTKFYWLKNKEIFNNNRIRSQALNSLIYESVSLNKKNLAGLIYKVPSLKPLT